MTYAANQRLCKSEEKHLIRKEWRHVMERLHGYPLKTDINHAYDSYELATTAGILELRLYHKLKPFTTDLGRFSRIDPKDLPMLAGQFKDLETAKASAVLNKSQPAIRFNRFSGKYNFMGISYKGLPAIEAELSQLLNKENVPSVTQS